MRRSKYWNLPGARRYRASVASWMVLLGLLPGLEFASLCREPEPGWPGQAVLTNALQFRTLPVQDYLRRFSFRLVGIVTLVDTNSGLIVLQDDTGAMAIDTRSTRFDFHPGQRLAIEGVDACPYLMSFPDYPLRPSGHDFQTSFEAPSNWGDYHLTRMRGFLRPPVTGNYAFAIASDNSSELWLSVDDDPTKVRRIAYVRQWVAPREWTREPGQRSAPILLRAGQSYYIEAFQEQLTEDDHVSVAWEGPGIERTVIDGRYLAPWTDPAVQGMAAQSNCVLREFWTNFFAGSLEGISGARPFDSALTAVQLRVTVLGDGAMPAPRRFTLGEELAPEDRYRWLETEGAVRFAGRNSDSANLEIGYGLASLQVRLTNCRADWPSTPEGWWVRVAGVCEGTRNSRGTLDAGLLRGTVPGSLAFLHPAPVDSDAPAKAPPEPAVTNNNAGLGGFYITYGLVTFNDRVHGQDCLFVQADNTAVFVSQERRSWGRDLKVGQWIEIGGTLLPGTTLSTLRPLDLRPLEFRAMPDPLTPAVAGRKDGRWTELEGVVRSTDPDGTLRLMEKDGPSTVWIGPSGAGAKPSLVDCTVRVRGVFSASTFDKPLLLVPSLNFVQVEETPHSDPFEIPSRPISALGLVNSDTGWVHRAKITGVVTYQDRRRLFIQDASGGALVKPVYPQAVSHGDEIEVAGFPGRSGQVLILMDAVMKRTGRHSRLSPVSWEPGQGAPDGHACRLVKARATVLGQRTASDCQVLDLEEEHHRFEALLAADYGSLPRVVIGSRVQVIGVSDLEPSPTPAGVRPGPENPPSTYLRMWLRGPEDLIVISGPPWWNWKRAALLVSSLVGVLAGSMLWIYLLRRRLEHQHAERLAFSRQILQTQESERSRIAANLHDSLGQNLLVIKNQLSLMMQRVKDESLLLHRLGEVSGLTSQAIEEVRQITRSLRPYQLDRLGLSQAIRATVQRVSENSTIGFASHIEDIDKLFDQESQIHLYRIVQESVNNIVKHSGATEAIIVIRRQQNSVDISIRDNGRGFDPGALNGPSDDPGFGLSGISERARILNGNMTVDSRPGAGTNLRIKIPVSQP